MAAIEADLAVIHLVLGEGGGVGGKTIKIYKVSIDQFSL